MVPTPRTAATLPTGRYSRPSRTDDTLRVVRFTDEDGGSWTFDFGDLTAPAALVDDLVAAVVAGSSPGGRWRTRTTVEAAVSMARQLAIYMTAEFPDVASIAEISPEVWWAWRSAREEKSRWPGSVNLARALLSESEKLSESTRRAMRAKTSKPRKRLPENDAYSRDEFARIRTAAKTQIRQASARIEANLKTMRSHQAGETTVRVVKSHSGLVWTAGSLLDYLSCHGAMPSLSLARATVLKGAFNLEGVTNPAQALFPSIREIYCLMVLLVCERGFNLSVMDNLTVNSFSSSDPVAEESVHTVDIDKPRRGAKRYSAEILTGDAGKLWETAVRLTQPCRDALQALGSSSDKLLIAHRHKNYSEAGGPFRTDWLYGGIGDHTMAPFELLSDDGSPLVVSLRRLRLSEQVLNQRARQNTDSVSEDVYRNRDGSAPELAAETIVDGQQDALDHARATVSVRSLSAAEVAGAREDPKPVAKKLGVSVVTLKLILAGQLDTPTSSCIDFHSSPFADAAGDPCPASFLACLACSNSVVTPQHLPRLVALKDALDNVATIVPEARWKLSYAEHYARLTAVIRDNATPAEVAEARQSLSAADRTLIEELLSRSLDA
jgi:hypothetical protein